MFSAETLEFLVPVFQNSTKLSLPSTICWKVNTFDPNYEIKQRKKKDFFKVLSQRGKKKSSIFIEPWCDGVSFLGCRDKWNGAKTVKTSLFIISTHWGMCRPKNAKLCHLQRILSKWGVLRGLQHTSSLMVCCRPTVKFRGQFVPNRVIPELVLRLVTVSNAASAVWALTTRTEDSRKAYTVYKL